MKTQKSYSDIWEYWHNEKKTIAKNCKSACFSCNAGVLKITDKSGMKITITNEDFQKVLVSEVY